MSYAHLLALTGLVFGAAGCATDPLVCTGELVRIPVTVVNHTAEALPHVSVRAKVLRTEELLDISAEHPSPDVPADGVLKVFIFSDAFHAAIRPSGEAVSVVITAGDFSAGALYEFGTDGCHVQKLAGPDSLELN